MVSVSGTEDEAATRRKFWASGLAGGGLTYHHGAGWYWISTTRSHPAASISLARVGSDGWRSPASYALITLCATPALKASSACDIPVPTPEPAAVRVTWLTDGRVGDLASGPGRWSFPVCWATLGGRGRDGSGAGRGEAVCAVAFPCRRRPGAARRTAHPGRRSCGS